MSPASTTHTCNHTTSDGCFTFRGLMRVEYATDEATFLHECSPSLYFRGQFSLSSSHPLLFHDFLVYWKHTVLHCAKSDSPNCFKSINFFLLLWFDAITWAEIRFDFLFCSRFKTNNNFRLFFLCVWSGVFFCQYRIPTERNFHNI